MTVRFDQVIKMFLKERNVARELGFCESFLGCIFNVILSFFSYIIHNKSNDHRQYSMAVYCVSFISTSSWEVVLGNAYSLLYQSKLHLVENLPFPVAAVELSHPSILPG